MPPLKKPVRKVEVGRVFLLYGRTGTGKTKSLEQMLEAGFRGFVHDADGQAQARLARYAKSGQATIERLRNYEQAVLWFSNALNGKMKGYDFYSLDTLSIFNEEAVRPDSERRLQAKTAQQVKGMVPSWDDRRPAAEMIFNILRWGSELADPSLMENPMHVIFTAHEAVIEDKEKKTLIHGPALPGRFAEKGPALVQECYHCIVVPKEEDPTLLDYWYVTKNDGTWPAKSGAGLEFFETADLAAVLKKIEEAA